MSEATQNLILAKLEKMEAKLDRLEEVYHAGDKAFAVFQSKIYAFAAIIAVVAAAAWDWFKSVFF